MQLLIEIYIEHIIIFGLTKLIYKKLYGSFVAKSYISNNSLRPTVPKTSSNKHSKSLLLRNLYTHKNVAVTLIIGATAVFFGVDTIVEILVCLPRVNHECNNLICLLKACILTNIEYKLFSFCFSNVI